MSGVGPVGGRRSSLIAVVQTASAHGVGVFLAGEWLGPGGPDAVGLALEHGCGVVVLLVVVEPWSVAVGHTTGLVRILPVAGPAAIGREGVGGSGPDGRAISAHGVGVLLAGQRLGSPVTPVVILADLRPGRPLDALAAAVAGRRRCLVLMAGAAGTVDAHCHVPVGSPGRSTPWPTGRC